MRTLRLSGILIALAPSAWMACAADAVAQTTPTQPLEVWTPEAGLLDASGQVLREIMTIPMRSIPRSLLAEARGVAILPSLVKGSFVVGVRHGRGIVVVRDETGSWGAPVFITMTGGSIGWQAGIQATDVILVFVTRESVRGLLRGKFTIGADAAATAGPLGREAALATDASLQAEIYSYSCSRGLFLGAALDGSALQIDPEAAYRYYGGTGAAVPGSPVPQKPLPPSASRLLSEIARWSAPLDAAPNPAVGLPAGAAANDVQAVQRQLAGSARRLNAILDEPWRKYLALPAEVYTEDRRPTADALRESSVRFSTVARNPSYRALTQRPEFQETYRLLERMAAVQTASLSLPPPPPK